MSNETEPLREQIASDWNSRGWLRRWSLILLIPAVYAVSLYDRLFGRDDRPENDPIPFNPDEPDLTDGNDLVTSFEAYDDQPDRFTDDSMSTDTPDETDSEQVYQNTRFGRTVTAERSSAGRGLDTVTVHVEDADQDVTVELTADQLADLSRGVGNRPRRPPRRDVMGTIEGHYEILDFGDFVSVETPYAEFKVKRRVADVEPPWIAAEYDEDLSWTVAEGATRNAALTALLERLGLVWNGDDSDD